MIYTCTLNPCVDYFIKVNDFKLGDTNVNKTENYTTGGKGINVSTVLGNLNEANTAIALLGGFTGQYIKSEINKSKYVTGKWIDVTGDTRMNINLVSKERTIIKSRGPHVEEVILDQLMMILNENIKPGDLFILSGSIPEGLGNESYKRIAETVTKRGANLIVDAAGSLLVSTLAFKPFFIKPNREEIEELFGVKMKTDEEYIRMARKLLERGASNVLLSLGIDGALLITKSGVYRANTVKEVAVNPVGAGDSMVAGFVYEYLKSNSLESALKYSVAAGTATALLPGFATCEYIQELLPQIKIHKLV